MIWLGCLAVAWCASFTESLIERLNLAVAITVPPTRYERHLKIACTGFSQPKETVTIVTNLSPIPSDEVMLGYLGETGVKIVDLLSGVISDHEMVGFDYVALFEMINYSLQRHHAVFNQHEESLRPWNGLHAFLADLKSSANGESRERGKDAAVIIEDDVVKFVRVSLYQAEEIGGIFVSGERGPDQQGKEGNVFYADPLKGDNVRWLAEHEHAPFKLTSQACLWYCLDLHLGEQGKRTLAVMIIAIAVEMVMEAPFLPPSWIKPLLTKSKMYWDLLGAWIRVRYEGCVDVERLAYLEPLLI